MYLVHNTGQIHQFFNEPKNCIFAYNSDRMRVYFCSWILVSGPAQHNVGPKTDINMRPNIKMYIFLVNNIVRN
jgi:hypothetical protein